MARIHITRPHQSDRETARAAAEHAAERMAEHYDIEYHWDGDHIHFHRTGVEGVMRIEADRIEIEAQLGFLVAMFRHSIEEEIEAQLNEFF